MDYSHAYNGGETGSGSMFRLSERGKWIQFRVYVKLATGPGQTDGIIRAWKWVEGTSSPELIFDKTNWGYCTRGNYIDQSYILGWANSGFAENTDLYVDNFAFLKDGLVPWGAFASPPGVPEVNVTGNSVLIADGDTTPGTSDKTDFGSVNVGSGSVTNTYTIQNTGTLPLAITLPVTISGTHASDFTVTTPPAGSVAAGATTTFSVKFDPSGPGLRSAGLSFGNNDADENPYNFSLQGSGDIIVDNSDTSGVTKIGTWVSGANGGYYGSVAPGYIHDDNTAKGSKSVRFTPNLPASGTYEVFVWWVANPNRATNVPIDIVNAGPTGLVQVNQRINGSTWVSLGQYTFNGGTGGSVLIGTTGTDGHVIADAVKFTAVAAPINFNHYTISGYSGGQDASGTYQIQDAGATLYLRGNTWKKIGFVYTITPATVLEFDFKSTARGELHGIGLDTDDSYDSGTTGNMFTLYGTDNGQGRQTFRNYSGTNWVHYTIPIGTFYTGSRINLFFVNDKDASPFTNTSYFRNVIVHE